MDPITARFENMLDGIKVVENWLSEEDIETAMSIINQFSVNHDATHSYPIHTLAEYNETKKETEFSRKFGNAMVAKASELYDEPITLDKKFLYVVHPTGTYIDPHTDILDIHDNDYEHESLDEQAKRWPYLWSGHCSILVYLNDEYEGGELYFPDLDFGIRPKKGMMITFPGNLYYTHGVAPVTSGTRYTLSQWCYFDNFK
jgi:hypothetical protein